MFKLKPCKVDFWKKIKEGVTAKTILFLLLGAMICSFGIHNIHQRTNITEGGVIGLMLLIEHWLQISPAYITPILDIACYGLALRFLGVNFIKLSVIATLFISGFYKIWEQFPYMLPDLSDNPLAAAILGGIFVGVGVGLCIRANAAPTGDDSLALSLSHHFKIGIQWVYLLGDLIVLALSLTYIPFSKIIYSLLTVVLSGQLIGLIQKAGKPKDTNRA